MINFAGQPQYYDSLTGYDLTTDIKPGQLCDSNDTFKSNHQFFKNFNNKSMFKNETGDYDYLSSEFGDLGTGDYGTDLTTNNTPAGDAKKDDKSWWDEYIGLNFGDLVKYGGQYYLTEQQKDLAGTTEEIKQRELAIERARAEQEKLKLEQAKLKNEGGFIKAYGTPIAITGAVIILGIATYFFFKKKKID